jgi:mannose-1-phosphate guanylyltransferase/mannose-1-phosphate guanylyltransferase/mannose-6-phosphate isomerase
MSETTRRITPVILSGGSGTRLWPLSRSERPKQLLALVETATMLQATAGRIGDVARFAPPVVVANARHAQAIGDQLRAVGIDEARLILEPVARNTAPAIALAALEIAAEDPATPILVMPSDHVIGNITAFHEAIAAALPAVAAGWLITFGIAPDAPETGYGYIRRGAPLLPGVDRVEAFIEKPDRDTASAYLADGRFSWNGGIFLFRADAFLAALENFEPAILSACRAAMAAAIRVDDLISADHDAFAASPSISVDYAVMERSDRVAVVPVDMAWSDVGSWDALYALSVRDGAGNRLEGDVIGIDTRDCFIRTEGPLVAAIGVSDITVIASDDAILIMPRGESQTVKRAIDKLKDRAHVSLDRQQRLTHSWGHERRVFADDTVELELIEVVPGATTADLRGPRASRIELVSGQAEVAGSGPLSGAVEIAAHERLVLVNTGQRPLLVLRTLRR